MFLELLLPLMLQASAEPQSEAAPAAAEVVEQAPPADSAEDADQSVVPDIVVTGEAQKPEPVRCRLEKTIGSGIKKKICRTESQIKAEALAGRNNANVMAREQQARSAAALNDNR